MGDFEHEETELEWINLFYSSITGYPTFKHINTCFGGLGYRAFIFPKFKIHYLVNNNNQKKFEITPDFLLWNEKKECVLIVEIKGGNSIDEKDVKQINNYKQISNEQIEIYINNVMDIKNVKVRFTSTCIVYKKKTIEKCLNSTSCNERLDILSKNNVVLMQNHNDWLKLFIPSGLDFDKNLKDALIDGIKLPLNPKTEFYMTDNPCIKGIIWGISNYIFDNFFEGEQIDEISVSPRIFRDKIFNYSMAKLHDFKIALEFLAKYFFCQRGSNYQFIFNKTYLKKYKQLKEILINYDCSYKISPQKNLSEYPKKK